MSKFGKLVGYDSSKGTTVKTELIAGVVTFLAMAYILAVNPGMLGIIPDGPGPAAIFMATIFNYYQGRRT